MPAIVSAKRTCCDATASSCWIEKSTRVGIEGEATGRRQAVWARRERAEGAQRLKVIAGREKSFNSKQKVVLVR